MVSLAVNAQDSKFYLGVGVGFASKGGDIDDGYKSGINLNFLNLGYRFSESWGMTANLSSSGHAIEDSDSAVGIGVFSIGPMYSFPVGNNVSWDVKPQYAFSMKGVYRGDDAANSPLGNLESIEYSGNGFLFGNSLVFGDGGSGFDFSLDFDYLFGSFNEVSGPGGTFDIDEQNKYNSLKIGVGLRYNF